MDSSKCLSIPTSRVYSRLVSILQYNMQPCRSNTNFRRIGSLLKHSNVFSANIFMSSLGNHCLARVIYQCPEGHQSNALQRIKKRKGSGISKASKKVVLFIPQTEQEHLWQKHFNKSCLNRSIIYISCYFGVILMHILIFMLYCKYLSSCLCKELLKIQKLETHCAIFLALFVNHFPQSTKTEEQIRTHSPHPAGYAFSCQTSFMSICIYGNKIIWSPGRENIRISVNYSQQSY